MALLGKLVFMKLWPLQRLLCALGNSPVQGKFSFRPPKQDSSVLEMRVEEMLYSFVLENVLQMKLLLFLAGD